MNVGYIILNILKTIILFNEGWHLIILDLYFNIASQAFIHYLLILNEDFATSSYIKRSVEHRDSGVIFIIFF